MSIPLNRHVKASFKNTPRALGVRDFTTPLLLTHNYNMALTKGRYMTVSSSDEVGRLFGLDSEVYQASKMAFGANNPPSKVMIGLWNKNGTAQLATANAIQATQTPAMLIHFNQLFNFTIKSNEYENTYTVDLTSTTLANHTAVVTALNTALSAGLGEDELPVFEFSLDNGKFVLSAVEDGAIIATENIEIITNYGRNIAELTRLSAEFNPLIIQGHGAVAGVTESLAQALVAISELTQEFYGVYSSEALTDEEIETLHEWVASSEFKRICAYTVTKDSELNFDESNVIYRIAKMNSGRFVAQLNKTGQKHAVVQLLVEATSTNWAGSNTAKTNKFKQQPLVMSDANITTNIADKCDALGINYYTDVRSYNMVAEGTAVGREWLDVTVFKDVFLDYAQVEIFNFLARNDVPQTDAGQQQLINVLLKVGAQFNRNGSLATGTWTLAPIGNLNTGDYVEDGFYFYSEPVANQLSADREGRKGMPINGALKYAGFMHTVDILLTLNQ